MKKKFKLKFFITFLVLLFETSMLSAEFSAHYPFINPKILKQANVEYPKQLLKKEIVGSVVLTILISQKGDVDSVEVEVGLHPDLDSAVVAALKDFKFSPAIFQGEPISTIFEYEFEFKLEDIYQSIINEIGRSVNFEGLVVEKGTRAPVQDAVVAITFNCTSCNLTEIPIDLYLEAINQMGTEQLEDNFLVTTTDDNGYFAFKSLPKCSLNVRVVSTGYESFDEVEIIQYNQTLKVLYRIEKSSYSDFEISVYGLREKNEVLKRSINRGELTKISGFDGDAIKSLQALPGVSYGSFFNSDFAIRGVGSTDSRFFIDGVDLPPFAEGSRLFHMGTLKSIYNSNAIDRVDMYSSGFGVRYGNSIGAVVDIVPRAGDSQRWGGFIDASFIDNSFMFEGPINQKVSILASARKSNNLFETITDNVFGSQDSYIESSYNDYVMRMDYTLTKNHSLYTTIFGAYNSLEEKYNSWVRGDKGIDNNLYKDRFNMVIFGLDSKIGQKSNNSFKFSHTYSDIEVSEISIYNINFNSNLFSVRNEFKYKLNDYFCFIQGIDLKLLRPNIYIDLFDYDLVYTQDTISGNYGPVGAYYSVEITPKDYLLLVAGLRYDYYFELDYVGNMFPKFYENQNFKIGTRYPVEASARFLAGYNISDANSIYLSMGNYNKTPEPIGEVTSATWGRQDLEVAKAMHYGISYEHKILFDYIFEFDLFHINSWDNVRRTNQQDFINDDIVENFYSDQRARSFGAEFFLKYIGNRNYFGWLAYTVSKSEKWNHNIDDWIYYDFDRKHNFQLLGNWKLPKHYCFGFRFQYATGNPYSPIESLAYVPAFELYEPSYAQENSQRNMSIIRLDLRLDKKIFFNRFIMTNYLEFQNVLNPIYKNIVSREYDYKNNVELEIYDMFIPSVGLKIEF